ncbi:hypothetical protein CPB84DRAFT_1758367 [Gymnopilus junonius]|uniref:Uncharacterized protein n=1 Tax=Gymnopilus junonius TaxID=109634 RepID=A0A9P5NZU0_GYMJU|nr:hypothetical protein CPB84DRAFT_1758367 [Gymnopilus junonius]
MVAPGQEEPSCQPANHMVDLGNLNRKDTGRKLQGITEMMIAYTPKFCWPNNGTTFQILGS